MEQDCTQLETLYHLKQYCAGFKIDRVPVLPQIHNIGFMILNGKATYVDYLGQSSFVSIRSIKFSCLLQNKIFLFMYIIWTLPCNNTHLSLMLYILLLTLDAVISTMIQNPPPTVTVTSLGNTESKYCP